MTNRYLCIHGHFYQPPRENPWLEAIELQDSAYPYHDWNERITAECYAPNRASRILNAEGRIAEIANNYSRISFDFGPTLLSWLEKEAPDVYQAVLAADRDSQERFDGHGAALAQAYNHMILPLANRRDKETQVLWGIRDFEHRFGRRPEGMWLPETAVDRETLDILAEHGIRFTILAQHQAGRVRAIGDGAQSNGAGEPVDPTRAYSLRLASGREIGLFFYHDPIARDVAFGGLLSSGQTFAQRLLAAFSSDGQSPQLVHVATDGETYGHHHRHGDMALAYALHHIESNRLATLTTYGAFLDRCPPEQEIEIVEGTSWSCGHGVERWRSDCGCSTGSHPDWSQGWRTPLREALDWLRDTLAHLFEERGQGLLKDPWAARNDYIVVVLDRARGSVDGFFRAHAARELSEADRSAALMLLELQRHAMLMYTSCGWFFDDLAGIETVQVLQYAGRAIQLARAVGSVDLEEPFLQRLERATSNQHGAGHGRRVYEQHVKPAMADLAKVGAYYAVSSLFDSVIERRRFHQYLVDREDYWSLRSGEARLVVGRTRITSEVTHESARLTFAVVHFGDHQVTGGVREFQGEAQYEALLKLATEAFSRADFAQTIRLLDREFGTSIYSLRSLHRDEQRRILASILRSTLAEAEAAYRQVYEHHAALMRFLVDLRAPLPRALSTAAEFILDSDLRRAFESETPDFDHLGPLLEEARRWHVALDAPTLEYALRRSIERLAHRLLGQPAELALLEQLDGLVGVARSLPFEVNLWTAQNVYYELRREVQPGVLERAGEGQAEALAWLDRFITLGDKLGFA